MAKFMSLVRRAGKRNEEGDVVQIPLDKAAYLLPTCEKALSLGMLPNPEDEESGYSEAWKKGDVPEIKVKKPQTKASEVKGGCFKPSDIEGYKNYANRVDLEFKSGQKKDIKRKKPWLS